MVLARQMTIPENLVRLHSGEEALRTETLRRIQASPDLADHISIIEKAMSLLHALQSVASGSDEDQITLGALGIRCFNSLASFLRLSFSGYYQSSCMHIRDVLEVAFLLDYFSSDQALISHWRTCSERDRKRQFSPLAVRVALDKRDKFTKQKRKKSYDELSTLAAHATPQGTVMLAPDRKKGQLHGGPFLEDTALNAVIAEAAIVAVQAANSFGVLRKSSQLEVLTVRLTYMQEYALWAKKFFNKEFDEVQLSEVREMLEKIATAKTG